MEVMHLCGARALRILKNSVEAEATADALVKIHQTQRAQRTGELAMALGGVGSLTVPERLSSDLCSATVRFG